MIQTVDLFVNVMKLSYSIIKSVMSHKFQKNLKKKWLSRKPGNFRYIEFLNRHSGVFPPQKNFKLIQIYQFWTIFWRLLGVAATWWYPKIFFGLKSLLSNINRKNETKTEKISKFWWIPSFDDFGKNHVPKI